MDSLFTNEINHCNKVKLELLRVVKCIDNCESEKEKEFYQDLAIEYSRRLKDINKNLEKNYHLKICCLCDEKLT